jgi:hypothetical protein
MPKHKRRRLPLRSKKLGAALGATLLTGIVAVVIVLALGVLNTTPGPDKTSSTTGAPGQPEPSPASSKAIRSGAISTRNATSTRTATPTAPVLSYPNQSNTGYQHAPGYPGSLTDCSKVAIQSNMTYKFCNFPNGLRVGNSSTVLTNVTFIGCRFAANAVSDADVAVYSDNVTFQYDTFEPNTVPMGSEPISPYSAPTGYTKGNAYGIDQRHTGKLTVDHSDFWGFADAIQFSYSTKAKPVIISHSWFHNPKDPGGTNPTTDDHTDGILNPWGGISYITIDNNSIIGDGNTQALALQGPGTYDHLWITNNYFSGYGYMICLGGHTKDTNVTFTGNVWSSEFEPAWGPLYDDVNFVTPGLGNTWSGNTYHVATGTTWLAKGNNGLYWWPDDAASTGQSKISTSRIIGHTIDYTGA